MEELLSIPESLRIQIQRASQLFSESEQDQSLGNHSNALNKAEIGLEILNNVAKGYPELVSLMGVIDRGHSGVEITVEEEFAQDQVVRLGLFKWPRIVPIKSTKRLKRIVRFVEDTK